MIALDAWKTTRDFLLRFQTSKWFLQSVRALRPDWRSLTGDKRLRLLEVGAINTQLLRCPWLLVRAIDLNSQHPDIEEMDFFDLLPEPVYDFVVSSMVCLDMMPTSDRSLRLNCVYRL